VASCLLAIVMVIGCGDHGPPYAESALQWAVPNPWMSDGRYIGMTHFTAAELNRIHQGSKWGPINFVDADVPSTRPDQISVNAIDDNTWGAAAYSVRAKRCYLIVTVGDRTDHRYGSTFYGRLPAGATCVGLAATPANATSKDPLPEG
jgi:hypothetical protein